MTLATSLLRSLGLRPRSGQGAESGMHSGLAALIWPDACRIIRYNVFEVTGIDSYANWHNDLLAKPQRSQLVLAGRRNPSVDIIEIDGFPAAWSWPGSKMAPSCIRSKPGLSGGHLPNRHNLFSAVSRKTMDATHAALCSHQAMIPANTQRVKCPLGSPL